MSPLRVVLADDHALVRAGIRALMERLPDVIVLAEAQDGSEAIEHVRTHRPDIVLMDIAMGRVSGLEAAATVAREFPEVKIVILSMHSNEEYVMRALTAGAVAYLRKDAAAHELGFAFDAIRRGGTYLSPKVSKQVIDAYVARLTGSTPPGTLTPRQREVLHLIANGRSAKEIALDLGLSVKTVETHRAQLMERLNIHDVAGLVKHAMRIGLIAPDT